MANGRFLMGVLVVMAAMVATTLMCARTGLKSFILIPAGTFMMGCAPSDSECESDEKPYHEVYLNAYYIQKHEVTVAEYKKCVNSGACTQPTSKNRNPKCNWGYSDRDNHPVNCVDWNQAKSYCEWIGGRLPTEAEWEKAARGTDGRVYPWGNATATCWYTVMDEGGGGCGENSTWRVCSKTKGNSPCGLCDMSGNVWEWVNDRYGKNYYSSSPRNNPQGPNFGQVRVLRGGSWLYSAFSMRISNRVSYSPDYPESLDNLSDYNIGFRCALGNP